MNDQSASEGLTNTLKKIRWIYFSMVGVIVSLAGTSFLLVRNGAMGPENNSMALAWLRMLLPLIPVSLAIGYIVFWIMLKKMEREETIEKKMQRYFKAALPRMIFFGIPGLSLCVASLASAQVLFLAIVPFILLVFLLTRPFRSAIADELKLSAAERLMMEGNGD